MNRQVNTVFIDVLFLILLVLILLPHQIKTEDTDRQPGQLAILASWEDGYRSDVDLWVKGPSESTAVGYSRLRGSTLSLLRDELGHSELPIRQEFAIGYDVPDGEYIINLHLYRSNTPELPIIVTVIVYVKPYNSTMSAKSIWSGSSTLYETGQETTVVRFSLQDMKLIPGSVNYITQSLRNSR